MGDPAYASPQFWAFAGASLLLLALAVIAGRVQAQTRRKAPERLSRLLGTPHATPGGGRWALSRGRWAVLSAVIVLGMIAYPFARFSTNIPVPYLVQRFPDQGPLLQASIGALLWAPTVVLAVGGLASAWTVGRLLRGARWPEIDSALPAAASWIPGVLEGQHHWFFQRLQWGLLLWGLVGGLGLSLVFLARPEWSIRIAAALILVGLLGVFFLGPLVVLARSLARASASLRRPLEARLQELRTSTIQAWIGQEAPPPPAPQASAPALADALASLPPVSLVGVLAPQFLRTLMGLVGPTVAVISKLVAG